MEKEEKFLDKNLLELKNLRDEFTASRLGSCRKQHEWEWLSLLVDLKEGKWKWEIPEPQAAMSSALEKSSTPLNAIAKRKKQKIQLKRMHGKQTLLNKTLIRSGCSLQCALSKRPISMRIVIVQKLCPFNVKRQKATFQIHMLFLPHSFGRPAFCITIA